MDSDELWEDGLDDKDFRPDAVITSKTISNKDLNGPRGFAHVHVPVEVKTATGSSAKDYDQKDKSLANLLAFVLSDAARDDYVTQGLRTGVSLRTGQQLQALYDGTSISQWHKQPKFLVASLLAEADAVLPGLLPLRLLVANMTVKLDEAFKEETKSLE